MAGVSDRTLLLVRHAETEYNRLGLVSGDPTDTECVLSSLGRKQARKLARTLADEPIDLCVTSELLRARETADIALANGVALPRRELGDLNDPRVGAFEAKTLASLLEWTETDGGLAAVPPEGGESFDAALRRWWRAYEWLIARPERTILVVCHAAPIAVLLNVIEGRRPNEERQVEHAVPYRVPVGDARAALRSA
jgi:uncharacterized phosphatase